MKVKDILNDNDVEQATTEWALLIFIASKQAGSLHFYDYRKQNVVTVRNSYTKPRVDECIYSPISAALLVKLDANSGY